MSTYTLTTNGAQVIRDDGAVIPADPLNADWQVYQVWLAAGNTPSPAPAAAASPPPPMTYVQFMVDAGIVTQAKATQILGGASPQ